MGWLIEPLNDHVIIQIFAAHIDFDLQKRFTLICVMAEWIKRIERDGLTGEPLIENRVSVLK